MVNPKIILIYGHYLYSRKMASQDLARFTNANDHNWNIQCNRIDCNCFGVPFARKRDAFKKITDFITATRRRKLKFRGEIFGLKYDENDGKYKKVKYTFNDNNKIKSQACNYKVMNPPGPPRPRKQKASAPVAQQVQPPKLQRANQDVVNIAPKQKPAFVRSNQTIFQYPTSPPANNGDDDDYTMPPPDNSPSPPKEKSPPPQKQKERKKKLVRKRKDKYAIYSDFLETLTNAPPIEPQQQQQSQPPKKSPRQFPAFNTISESTKTIPERTGSVVHLRETYPEFSLWEYIDYDSLKDRTEVDATVIDAYLDLLSRQGKTANNNGTFLILPCQWFIDLRIAHGTLYNQDKLIELLNTPGLKSKTFFDYQNVYIPCNYDSHWVMLNIIMNDNEMQILDPRNGGCWDEIDLLTYFLHELEWIPKNKEMDYDYIDSPEMDEQSNDCGVYILECMRAAFHEGLDKNGDFIFTQQNIPDIRNRIETELRNKKLKINYQYKKDPKYPPIRAQSPPIKEHPSKKVKPYENVPPHDYFDNIQYDSLQKQGEKVDASVIDAYFKLLDMQGNIRNSNGSYLILPTVWFFTLSTNFKKSMADKVKEIMTMREMKDVDFNNIDNVYIPCYLNEHWLLLNLQLKQKAVQIINSGLGFPNKQVELLEIFLKHVGWLSEKDNLQGIYMQVPKQAVGFLDCGVFMMEYLRCIMHEGFNEKGKPGYDVHCIPGIRKRIEDELKQKQLISGYKYISDKKYPPKLH